MHARWGWLFWALAGTAASAQEDPDLSSEKTLRLLLETRSLMEEAESLLQESSRPQEDAIRRIEELLGKSQDGQKGAVEKLNQILRQARGPGNPPSALKPQAPTTPPPSPYVPDRSGDSIDRFRFQGRGGRWGDLPPRLREAMLSGKQALDDFPPEYRQRLQEYFRALTDGEK